MEGKDVFGSNEGFIRSLRAINELVDVDPALIDLLEAYARIQLEKGEKVNFFPDYPPAISSHLADFLEKNKDLDPEALRFLAAYFTALRKKGIIAIWNIPHLAYTLDLKLQDLLRVADDAQASYHTYFLPKRHGGKREVNAPNAPLKQVQRRILDRILRWVPLDAHAEGFRPTRSIITNSTRHIGKQIVAKFDVKDFFPSITVGRVQGVFTSLGYPANVVNLLTQLTTHNGRLPTGSPTSPVISNILCRHMDKRFSNLGEAMSFSYSRYADDLTFSSDNVKFPKLVPFLKEIIVDEGFVVNEPKIRLMRAGRRQQITGIVVNERATIAREVQKKLRAVIYNCHKNGMKIEAEKWAKLEKKIPNPEEYDIDTFRKSLLSKIRYVSMIDPSAGDKLLAQYNRLS